MRQGQTTARSGPTAVAAPLILERYRLYRRLGSGGFGTVWAAHDERLGRDVAVKILPAELVAEGRFEREAHAAARLSHPAVVTLYEAAADDDGAYLVSELVRGATLGRALETGRLSDRDILAIGCDLCDALAHAHSQGVVHRDLKPSNVLLPSSGARAGAGRTREAGPVAKLTDFGVARLVGGDTLTRTGELVGTTAYMAPEQAQGRQAGEPADVYALAVVLYEALTGLNPLVAMGAWAERARRLAPYLPPLRRQRRELPRELGQAIDLALRPLPRERGSIGELRAALEECLEEASDTCGVVAPPLLAPGIESGASGGRRSERGHIAGDFRRGRARSATEAPGARGRNAAPPRPRAAPGLAEALGAAEAARRAPGAPSESGRAPRPRTPPAPPPPPPVRGLAAALSAAVAYWVGTDLLHPVALPPATLALGVAVAVLVLPRLGWLAAAAAAVLTLSLQGHAGSALLFGVAAFAPLLVLPRASGRWPLAATAPLLGLVGLAGAWPTLAAQARGPWRRAALGALGWAWLLAAEALCGRELYVHLPAGLQPLAVWSGAPYMVTHHVIGALAGELAAGALVWGLGAAALPWLRTGRSPGVDAAAVAVWALAVDLSLEIVLAGAGAPGRIPAGTLLAGTVAAALCAVATGPFGLFRVRDQSRGAMARLA